MEANTQKHLEIAVKAAAKLNGSDQIAIAVGELFPLADVFLLVSGDVERNVQAIAREIEDELNQNGVKTLRREGREGGRWILLDFGDLIVHVFHREERDYYELERLWSDCEQLDLSDYLAEGSRVDPVAGAAGESSDSLPAN